MKIAIVGTSSNLSENQEKDMREYITIVLKRYDIENDIIISGGGKGVDITAIEIAKDLGFQTFVFKPDIEKWETKDNQYGRKARNITIAEECDALHCFSIPVKTQKCYHHDEPMEHEKTAGCWTACKAFEQDKTCELIVIPDRESMTTDYLESEGEKK